jgi:SRSO17 transposase
MTSAGPTHDCRPLLDDLLDGVAPRFTRPEPRLRAQLFVRGILSGLARKNSWTLAEYAGESDPNGMQRLLTSARWDVDGVRNDLRDWVLDRLADPEYGVLIPLEAGFPKKGTGSVGVHRHYNDAARRAENVQVGLFLAYASPQGWALVDRELYLPPSWAADAERCERLGVPEGVGFLPKPELARRMIERVLDSGVPVPWVTAGETFGADPALRYGLATRSPDRITPGVWARSPAHGSAAPADDNPEWERLLVARPTPAGNRLVQYECRVPAGTTMQTLSRVTGTRYRVEERFASARGEMGLDHYQVRRYDAWYRHVTLCLLAGAYLTTVRGSD